MTEFQGATCDLSITNSHHIEVLIQGTGLWQGQSVPFDGGSGRFNSKPSSGSHGKPSNRHHGGPFNGPPSGHPCGPFKGPSQMNILENLLVAL